jgi:hypothetical protein
MMYEEEQLRDVMLTIASVNDNQDDPKPSYFAITHVFRMDLDGTSDDVAAFVRHVANFPKVVHTEVMGANDKDARWDLVNAVKKDEPSDGA